MGLDWTSCTKLCSCAALLWGSKPPEGEIREVGGLAVPCHIGTGVQLRGPLASWSRWPQVLAGGVLILGELWRRSTWVAPEGPALRYFVGRILKWVHTNAAGESEELPHWSSRCRSKPGLTSDDVPYCLAMQEQSDKVPFRFWFCVSVMELIKPAGDSSTEGGFLSCSCPPHRTSKPQRKRARP